MAQHDRLFRIRTLVALSLLVLAPLAAEAAGTITGVKVTPSPSTVGTTVMVWVNGSGVCGELELDFGDGTAKAKLGGAFNLHTQHAYTQEGTFSLKAKKKSDCEGEALASHTVVQGGQITGLSVPSSASPNSQVPITVQGTGTCGSLQLDFGDGAQPTFPQVTFPMTVQHPYAATGSKTLKATAGTQCQGQAQATLQVKSLLVGLCAKIACGGVLVGPPKIDAIVPLVSNITPGGAAVVKGSWFGNDQGELYLKGLKKWNGEAYGDVKLSIKKELGKDFWKTTGVIGFIPGDITQVKDQPAKLQIKTAANKWSNEVPVNFMAKKDYVTLLSTDAAVQVISCGTGTSKDTCNSWIDPDDDPSLFPCSEVNETFCGGHVNALWATLGTDTGVDKYQITLKNGWVLEFMDFTKAISAAGEASVTAPSGFTPGSTSWQPHVPWSATADDFVFYAGYVTIAGPKGVPWK